MSEMLDRVVSELRVSPETDPSKVVSRAIRSIFQGNAVKLAELVAGCPDVVKASDPAMNDCSALHVAVGEDMFDCVKALVSAGAPCDLKDSEGRSPLHMVCPETGAELVEMLLKAGAAVDARDNDGRTPLHVAVEIMAVDVVSALVAAGADAKAASRTTGATPLQIASTGVTEDAEDDDDDEDDEEQYEVHAKRIPSRNWLIRELLGAAADVKEGKWMVVATMEKHNFECEFVDSSLTATSRVQLTVRTTVEEDEEDSDSDNEAQDENGAISESVTVELLSKSPTTGLWHCWITETPKLLSEKCPELMLVKGRELFVSSSKEAATPPTMAAITE